MENFKVDICFIGNAIVDILSKVSFKTLNKLEIIKGSMQLVDEEASNEILKYIINPSIISGGSAANTAVGFKSFGGKCSFIGQIGNDKFGDLFLKDLNNSGVSFQDIDYLPPEKTSKCIVLVTPDAERSMITYLGASNKFNINSFDEQLIINSNMIYIEGYLFDQPEAKEAIFHCCNLAKSHNKKIALSLSDLFCVERHRIDFLNLITHEKLLFLSCGTKRNLLMAPIPSKVVANAIFNKNAFP